MLHSRLPQHPRRCAAVAQIQVPQWTELVKTGTHKELAPYDPDWFYIRCAAIARRLYCRGGVGVGALRKVYGGPKNRGARKLPLSFLLSLSLSPSPPSLPPRTRRVPTLCTPATLDVLPARAGWIHAVGPIVARGTPAWLAEPGSLAVVVCAFGCGRFMHRSLQHMQPPHAPSAGVECCTRRSQSTAGTAALLCHSSFPPLSRHAGPTKFTAGSGSIARKALQCLESIKVLEKCEDG